MKRHIAESVVLATLFTVLSYFVALKLDWVTEVNWLEAFAVFTSYACTWLCVRQRRINYPIGAVSSLAYAILFWQNGLLASAVLNAYLVGALVYGWFRWREDANTRPVSTVTWYWWPVYGIAVGAAYWGAAHLSAALGGTLVWTDSIILVLTLMAQFLLDNKKIETWAVWVGVNVFALITYTSAGLYLVSFQYILFLINTGIGFLVWRKAMNKSYVCINGSSVDPVDIKTWEQTGAGPCTGKIDFTPPKDPYAGELPT